MTWMWIIFGVSVPVMLALDLGLHRGGKGAMSVKDALLWSGIWIFAALAFNGLVYVWFGLDKALEFFTGYLIEKSLSVDNIFVFALIFSHFTVPAEYQRKVLLWGIIGALIMRAILIVIGASLISTFHWLIYIFGAFLIATGIKMMYQRREAVSAGENWFVRLVNRILPVTDNYHGDRFFVRENARLTATPLFAVLLLVEFSDLIFAVDSIPAIFAVTTDPFIVYTSNVFAILGLRALYFALAGVLNLFYYLKIGLSLILVFVGIKMLLAALYKIPPFLALGVIALILTVSIIASLVRARRLSPAEKI